MAMQMHWVVEFSLGLGLQRLLFGEGGMGLIRRTQRKKPILRVLSVYTDSKVAAQVSLETNESSSGNFPLLAALVANPATDVAVSSDEKVYDVILKQAALVWKQQLKSSAPIDVKPELAVPGTMNTLKEAYDRCGEVCAEYAKTFYLGTLLMTPERRKAIWAIYVWCRRTDELVDGPNASHITPSALDRWESRLEDFFAGRPYDMFDAALSDTVTKFPVDIQVYASLLLYQQILDETEPNDYSNFIKGAYVSKAKKLMALPIAHGR